MENPTLSGKELEKALLSGKLEKENNFEIIGMVKSSNEKGHISVTLSGCDNWLDLPTDMIKEAEKIGIRTCSDHSHVIMRITLNEPKNKESKMLLSLLSQNRSSFMSNSNFKWGRKGSSVYKIQGHPFLTRGLGSFANPVLGNNSGVEQPDVQCVLHCANGPNGERICYYLCEGDIDISFRNGISIF